MTRATLYVLLPICLVYALFLVWQGVPQNFAPYTQATTLEGAKQTIAQGPVASQEAIKMLGTNGGGFFNANSAHPYENPTPLTNLLEMLSIFLIPAGLTYTFGRMVGNTRQGWAIFAAMAFMFVGGLGVCYWAEAKGNPNVAQLGRDDRRRPTGQPGGNMEGKETRFGIADFRALRHRHDRRLLRRGQLHARQLHPARRRGAAGQHDVRRDHLRRRRRGPLRNADVRRGRGLHRRPDGRAHAGVRRQEDREVRGADGDPGRAHPLRQRRVLDGAGANVNLPPGSTRRPSRTPSGRGGAAGRHPRPPGTTSTTAARAYYYGATYNNVNNAGAHGFSEILYAYGSQTGNNGSAFAGLTGNTPYYNMTLGLAMLIGRFLMIIPLLAMAGSLARKKVDPGLGGHAGHRLRPPSRSCWPPSS